MKKAMLAGLLLSGCASAPVQDESESENPAVEETPNWADMDALSILEKADHVNARLSSYHVSVKDEYNSDEGNMNTSMEAWVAFDDASMYLYAKFDDGTSRLAKADIGEKKKHTLDGDQIETQSSTSIFINDQNQIEMVQNIPEAAAMEDWISLPAYLMASSNTYSEKKADDTGYSVEITGFQLPASSPAQVDAKVVVTIDNAFLLQEIRSLEEIPDVYSAIRALSFDGWDEPALNLEQIDACIGQAQDGSLQAGDALQISWMNAD